MPPPCRRALVTGGSRGLGLAVARALARDGRAVAAPSARDEAAAGAARAAVAAERLSISLLRCDAGSSAEVEDLFAHVGPTDVREQGLDLGGRSRIAAQERDGQPRS